MMVKILLMGAISLLWIAAKAQQPSDSDFPHKSVEANRATGSIRIDGVLNEVEWNLADSASTFVQVEPNQGTLAQHQTVVKVLFDDTSLYIAAMCYDSAGKKGIRVTELYRDFVLSRNDVFAVCIDAFNDKRNNITFAANPFGAQYDYLSFDALLVDQDWNGLWKVRTAFHANGWSAEFAIPWKTIRYDRNEAGQTWGVNFYRQRRLSNETSTWSPYPRSFSFNRMEFAGSLTQLDPRTPSANVQLNPYGLVSQTRSAVDGTTKMEYKAGGEIKWAINSNSVLDLTANTDFAQANADIAVNNITRFSVLFPERRQFFLENASLFGGGLNGTGGSMYIFPFFSRTIGLQDGNPVPINGGARFVHRSPRQNFGAMAIQQAGTAITARSNFAVARYSRNFSAQNRVGGLLTAKNVGATTEESSYNNVAAMADGFFRFNDNNAMSVMGVYSSNDRSGSGSGFAGYAQYFYTTNAVQAWYTQSVVSKNYRNEMGFTSRQDVICTSPGFFTNLRGKWLPLKKWVRAVQPDIQAEFYHQASTGKLIEGSVAIYPVWFLLHSGGFFGYSFTPAYQHLTEPFAPLGISIDAGSYRYNRSTFYFSSDPSKRISYSLIHDVGRYFDGRLISSTAALTLSPIPHIMFKASWSGNSFREIGPEQTSAMISLFTGETRLAVNPRLQFNGLVQHNSQNGATSIYGRLSWEYRPLSYVFLVVTNKEVQGEPYRQQDAILKVSYLKQL